MTDREIGTGLLVVSVAYSAIAVAFGWVAVSLVDGLEVIPATLAAGLAAVGALFMGIAAIGNLFQR